MLDDLLSIKRRREDQATAAVAEAIRVLDAARDACRAKGNELQEYGVWQESEKERLFEEMRAKSVSRADLEEYREQLGLLRQRHLQLQEELADAERDVVAAEGKLDEARHKRLEAHREVVKFEEFKRVRSEEQLVEAERREEGETEDIVSGRY